MNSDPRKLFDSTSLALHRARATESGLFLHDLSCDLISERLEEVNRSFTKAAIISWQAPRWARSLGLEADQFTASETLELTPESQYDLIIHGLELHWSEDPVGQLIQMRRALKPDGLMIAAMFGSGTLTNFRDALTRAEVSATGGLSPRMAPLADLRDLGGLLQRAGYALPVADNFFQKVEYSSLWSLLHDLRAMGETNALADRIKVFSKSAIFRELENSLFSNGPRLFEYEIVFLTGWGPSANQQKPLKPGSATHSLAEVLTQFSKG
ncbi:MAG: SAM-dependent methyltransferase [Pseudomonadota bacterium]